MESLTLELANQRNTGLKMEKKDNIVFVDFWDAFSNKLETKILDSCHKFKLLEKPLKKNKDAKNILVYQLANLLLSNFVIKRQKEDIVFIVCEKSMDNLEICDHFEPSDLFDVCIKILKKFEKYLNFTVIEYEGSFVQFSKLIGSDSVFYKTIVSKIINSILVQSSKNFSMKDIQKVLKEYNLSNSVLKKNYSMKLE
jgi:hypothetical protein